MADETLLACEGVCRDMAHLVVSFLRALEVPANALLEAHDGVAWRIIDVTGLAPVESLGRIATGRDAADVAWASTSGDLQLNDVVMTAEQEPS